MKKFIPSELKFLRSSDILSYANVNTNEIISSLKKLLGSIYYYYFIDQPINNVFDFEIKSISDDKFLTVAIANGQEFTFIDNVGLSNSKKDECATFSLIYDENNPLNGSQSNPITIPSSILNFEYVASYSKGLFSYVYVNGHPQASTEYNIYQEDSDIKIYFTRIKQGKISPLPKNKDGLFNKDIVTEISWSEFKNNFCVNNDSSKCYIEFPLINLAASNRDLVLEVKLSANDWLNVIYYHVPKDFPIYNSQISYKISEDAPNKILINLSTLPLDPNDKLSFYFLEKLPSKKFDSDNITSFQYYLPVQNISSETFSYIKVLALNSSTGMFTNLMDFNETLLTKVVDINLNGILNINSAFLYDLESPIYAFDYIINTPLPVYTSLDMPNNVTFAGILGGSIKIPNDSSEKHYKLYIKNIEVPELGQTFYNSISKKTSQVSIKNIRPHFLLVENNVTVDNSFMFLGDIVVNGTTFSSFTPNYQLNVNDITQLLNEIGTFNTTLQNINTQIQNLTNEVYGTTYTPNTSRPPILQRLDNLTTTINTVQNNLNALSNSFNSFNLQNVQDQINLLNSYISDIKDTISFADLSSETNEKGIFILNKDFINTFLNNNTNNIINVLRILEQLANFKYDFYIIPINYRDFVDKIYDLTLFLKNLKNIYISNVNKKLPKPVLLLIFNSNIDRNNYSVANLLDILKTNKLNQHINIGLQIEPTYTDLNNNNINFTEIKNFILNSIYSLKNKLFLFSYNLQNLKGLLPKEVVDNSILITSSRYVWKKSINSNDLDFSNYYSINAINDLFDLSVFCSSSNKIALCDLVPSNAYSDLSFIDLSLDTNSPNYSYNNSYDAISSYLKAKNLNLINLLEFRDIEAFDYRATTDLSQWNILATNSSKSEFLELRPKIKLYQIAGNNLTNTEPYVYNNNNLMYKLYIIPSSNYAGNVFEVTDKLMFTFNNANFDASIMINGILDFLSSYTNLINISLFSGTLTITDSSNTSNSVSYTLPNNPIHNVYFKFTFETNNNILFVDIKIYNTNLNLSIQNVQYPLTSMSFKITNLDTNDLLISKLYV